jgi:homospermidine synthase
MSLFSLAFLCATFSIFAQHDALVTKDSSITQPISYNGKILIVGFGGIGSGLLPLLHKHLTNTPIEIIAADNHNQHIADAYNTPLHVAELREDNYTEILNQHLSAGDFLVNLSVEVSSLALIKWCHDHHVLYIDTCIEPWSNYYVNPELTASERSNYWLRKEIMCYKDTLADGAGATAIIAHGANPGLASHFVKEALLQIAAKNNIDAQPITKVEWQALAHRLNIKVIQVAECDTQRPANPKKRDEFVNTWSVSGLIAEGSQPAELGWGTHEKNNELCRLHGTEDVYAAYFEQPGLMTKVRSWTPLEGPMHAWMITHNESISLADYFTHHDNGVTYRPTVYYAYHPSDSAISSIHELLGKQLEPQTTLRLIGDEIIDGMDELGVLLMGNEQGSLWYGSQLTIDEARNLAPHNSATTLQVTSSVLAGIIWAIENPTKGIVEAEDMPHDYIINLCKPYLGTLTGVWTNWTPLENRNRLFTETVDQTDPWQLDNFLVA